MHLDRENRIGSEPCLVWCPVSLNHYLIHTALIGCVQANDCLGYFTVNVGDCRPNILSAVRGSSPSLSSTASFSPVEAPNGTAAIPCVPSANVTSTSIVGLPRESRISRPMIDVIVVMKLRCLYLQSSPQEQGSEWQRDVVVREAAPLQPELRTAVAIFLFRPGILADPADARAGTLVAAPLLFIGDLPFMRYGGSWCGQSFESSVESA